MSADSSGRDRDWTVLELLRWTSEYFESCAIESSRLDAECLLAEALGVTRLELYVKFDKPVAAEERARFRELVRRRGSQRVPVSQILGRKEFWSLCLKITGEVLTPRPETETLVQAALDRIPDPEGDQRVLDVGTGSGAVALAIARERPRARVTATDISAPALQIARENAEELHLNEGLRFLEGDLLDVVEGERFDLVVSNPPYLALSEAATLPPELAHEPELALFGGDDGYSVLRPLVKGVSRVLVPGGSFAVEVAPQQAEIVASLCVESGLGQVEILRDLARRPRVVAARK
jgi:release factor glutamine methyltransferase